MALVTNFIENKLKVAQTFEKFHVQALFANNYNKSYKVKFKKRAFFHWNFYLKSNTVTVIMYVRHVSGIFVIHFKNFFYSTKFNIVSAHQNN